MTAMEFVVTAFMALTFLVTLKGFTIKLDIPMWKDYQARKFVSRIGPRLSWIVR